MTFRRCPTCGSRVASNAASCPICGHEFPPAPAAPPSPITPPKPKFTLAQLPWGVIGVAAVIIALGVGGVLLLRDTNGTQRVTSTGTALPKTLAAGVLSATHTVSATWTATIQAPPTDTPLPPTETPVPMTPTPVPPQSYEVQSGDTCGGIASKYGVPLADFLALNQLDENNCLIRVGDKVLIPAPTPTAGPSPTLVPGATEAPTDVAAPTATLPPQIIVQVMSGDTCSEIAEKYRITVDTLVQQNGLDADCNLQIGQVLTLTFATAAPAISPTPIIAQTPTPRVGYDAPVLISPQDGDVISETEEVVTLQWLSVGVLQDDQWYVVQVQPSGAITVPVFEVKATSLKLTRSIFDGQTERSFAWWVQVKQLVNVNTQTGERVYNVLSDPSEVRRFTWRRPIQTPTPTPSQ
jgi:LysM repeat protein